MNIDKINAVLRNNGHLVNTEVVGARLESFESVGIASDMFRLHLKFSNKEHELCEKMIVKRPKLVDRGRGEVEVYELIFKHDSSIPTIPYYGFVDNDPDTGLNLLFEDLSATHHQTVWPIIPSFDECLGAVTALAKLHANWWGQTDLFSDITPSVAAHQDVEKLYNRFPRFVDLVGEYLSRERLVLYERILQNHVELLEKRETSERVTFLHTDSHFWNYLYPNSGNIDACVMFDWPLWRTGIAGSDLAYLIALHLYPEHRARFESSLLDQYLRVLNSAGVNYDRAELQIDYRVGVIIGFLMPIMEFSWNVPPDDWIPKLEKAFATFFDLDCGELLNFC